MVQLQLHIHSSTALSRKSWFDRDGWMNHIRGGRRQRLQSCMEKCAYKTHVLQVEEKHEQPVMLFLFFLENSEGRVKYLPFLHAEAQCD